ncbi:hypothetical protein [Hafnia paralvei]|uniref:hypothetical protein n=1 Tax=Hafnia paralvei TaxID=546367 RepID=UPI00210E34E0|nr:hypothetical protein [Hafnia paralvei]MCQ4169680.1 hypothetical protein [Hafnia paralvei]
MIVKTKRKTEKTIIIKCVVGIDIWNCIVSLMSVARSTSNSDGFNSPFVRIASGINALSNIPKISNIVLGILNKDKENKVINDRNKIDIFMLPIAIYCIKYDSTKLHIAINNNFTNTALC